MALRGQITNAVSTAAKQTIFQANHSIMQMRCEAFIQYVAAPVGYVAWFYTQQPLTAGKYFITRLEEQYKFDMVFTTNHGIVVKQFDMPYEIIFPLIPFCYSFLGVSSLLIPDTATYTTLHNYFLKLNSLFDKTLIYDCIPNVIFAATTSVMDIEGLRPYNVELNMPCEFFSDVYLTLFCGNYLRSWTNDLTYILDTVVKRFDYNLSGCAVASLAVSKISNVYYQKI